MRTHQRNDKIDIHDYGKKLQRDLRALDADTRLFESQRTLIKRFVHDARIGRTVARRARKQISDGRCQKFIYHLRRFAIEMGKTPLNEVTADQMEVFILGLESGTVTKLKGGGAYAHETVIDYKKILRKFYGYVHGESSAKTLDLVGWFDMHESPPELNTFGLKEVQQMTKAVAGPQGRALIMLCFDGGFRPGELFNVRLRDVVFKQDDEGTETVHVRIRHSKTKPRTISLPLATEEVKFWIKRHPSGGNILDDGTINARDPNATLIAWSYHYCRNILNRLGKDELHDRLYFYRFRHASATFYAKHLTEYQMCARYGWVMGSNAVRRYVDASGVLAQDTAALIREYVFVQSSRVPHSDARDTRKYISTAPINRHTIPSQPE